MNLAANLSEKYTPITSSALTGTNSMDGLTLNLNLQKTSVSVHLSPASIMESSASKAPKPSKIKREKSDCSDHSATLLG